MEIKFSTYLRLSKQNLNYTYTMRNNADNEIKISQVEFPRT